jgi:hypothetical protein
VPAIGSDASTITTPDSTGCVVLPAEVRRKLRQATGARFSVGVVADCIELTLEAPPEPARLRKGGHALYLHPLAEVFSTLAGAPRACASVHTLRTGCCASACCTA